jgi:hypothetical protein
MKRHASLLLLVILAIARGAEPCRINVTDAENGWPVPQVELRTTHNVRFISDNAGVIAFDLTECMGRDTWFTVKGHGYDVKRDGFGMSGVRLVPEPGKTLNVRVTRTNIAKRLGRITGAGLFGEAQKLGEHTDWRDGGVFGCDSVQNAVYRGKMFWAWGDTTLAGYPLGVFDMSSATTSLTPLKEFVPPIKLPYTHFTDANGRVRGVARMAGDGPTWVNAYVTLHDKSGAERLVGTYSKIRNHLEVYELGTCVWDDATDSFKPHRVLWNKDTSTSKRPSAPDGHPSFYTDARGKRWVLFGNPLPSLRCPATFDAWADTNTWEVLKPPTTLTTTDGSKVKLHTGHIAWNAFRQKWVTVFNEAGGKPSTFGELWYAESRDPLGAWGKAVKILTHDNYTFYNPRLHPEFTPTNSPVLLFEGTFTAEFANRPEPTPRHDYNQVLYRLDLDDPRLKAARE